MSKFKPGPAKTRDGRDAVIDVVTSQYLFGRIANNPCRWRLDGMKNELSALTSSDDVMPPLREWWLVPSKSVVSTTPLNNLDAVNVREVPADE